MVLAVLFLGPWHFSFFCCWWKFVCCFRIPLNHFTYICKHVMVLLVQILQLFIIQKQPRYIKKKTIFKLFVFLLQFDIQCNKLITFPFYLLHICLWVYQPYMQKFKGFQEIVLFYMNQKLVIHDAIVTRDVGCEVLGCCLMLGGE